MDRFLRLDQNLQESEIVHHGQVNLKNAKFHQNSSVKDLIHMFQA